MKNNILITGGAGYIGSTVARLLEKNNKIFIIDNLVSGNKKLLKIVIFIGFTLLLQVLLGIITILSGVKIIYASLHQINSILIILSTLYFLYILEYKKIN